MANLIVEDGTIVPNANTYLTPKILVNYCNDRNLDIPDDEDKLTTIIINAMDYLEQFRGSFKGTEIAPMVQSLSFPRKNLFVYNNIRLREDKIPDILIKALCVLCVDVYRLNGNLQINVTDYAVKQEVIGPLSTTYAITGKVLPLQPVLTKFMNTIAPLVNFNSGINARTYR